MAKPAGSIAFRTVYTEQPAVLPDFQCPFKNTSVRVQIKIILPRPFAVDRQMAGNAVVPRIFPPDEIKFVPSFLKNTVLSAEPNSIFPALFPRPTRRFQNKHAWEMFPAFHGSPEEGTLPFPDAFPHCLHKEE